MNPLVSVIIPVYNVEDYLQECLDTVLNQTYNNIEIICINDGSTDSSLSILQDYEQRDSRIKVFTKENEGLGGASARNYGLEKAVGDYVSILDSDDFFDLTMIEKAVNRAEKTDSDIVVFGGNDYDDKSHVKRKSIGILDENYIPAKIVFSHKDCPNTLYQISQGMAWNKLYRHSFLNKYGLKFQSIKYTDDAYFTFAHMALANRITIINESLVNYRINSGRNQTSGIANYPDSSYVPYIKLKNSLEEWGIYEFVKCSFVNCVSRFIRYCYEKIDRYDAFVYLHNKLRDYVFNELDITGHATEYFHDKRVALWIRQVEQYEAVEILFLSARAHGSLDSTTGILRFLFPYEAIPKGSKIVIVGARTVGQHYYSQAILSGYYDVVMWVDTENPGGFDSIKCFDWLNECKFDYVLIAHFEKNKIENALSILKEAGVSDERIIIGEENI